MATRLPLLIQFEYHVGSKEAAATAEWLHSKFNDDPAVPGIRIPTCFTPNDGSFQPPQPRIAPEAERVMVIVLCDDYLSAKARTPMKSGTTWGDYMVELWRLCEARSKMYKFVPVQLTELGWPLDTRLADLNAFPAWSLPSDVRRQLIASRLANLLIRQLRQNPDEPSSDQESPPVTIFLSHTKLDLGNKPYVVKSLLAHLTASQPEKTWFDSGDIVPGSPFKKAIERGVKDAALLAVVTDSYSSRSWCRREVLLAKHHKRPVVVVDAIQEKEVRSFPYAGNVPVIRWNGRPQDVINLLLLETLRHAYAEESLKQRKRPGDEVFPGNPELLTVVNQKCKAILYPDPPLGQEELAILSKTSIQVETPLERHALENNLRARSLIVALSVSEAEDLACFGLRKCHLDSVLLELSRYLLIAGVRLAYGGHLRTEGYTIRLANLLYDPTVEQLRGEDPTKENARPAELITYLAWPTLASVQDEASLGPRAEVLRCGRPAEVSEILDPLFLAEPLAEIPVDSPIRRFAWARGLTRMRERQTSDVSARIVISGRLGRTDGYKGRMPGVLEEALLSIQAKRPIYIIGAFGGCARLVIDALEGIPREELTNEYQNTLAYSAELRSLYEEYKLIWDEYRDISLSLHGCGYNGLHNGLSIDENRELATTRSVERIIELIFSGLNLVTVSKEK